MSDQPADLMLVFLRRLDGKMDVMREDMADLRRRVTVIEVSIANQAAMTASQFANLSLRMDTMGDRLDRIERRLEFAVV